MSTELRTFVEGLPKAELHIHVEGTLEPELEFECARRNNIDIGAKTVADIDHSYGYGLKEFLKAYYTGIEVLRTEQDFYELTWAYLEKMAQSNVKHVELFFDPQAHTRRGVGFSAVINGIHRAIVDARSLGVDTRLIMCFLRDMSKESAWQTLKQAEPYHEKGWIVGVGLDSAEHHNPPLKFMLVFAEAKAQGYYLTMHCDPRQVDAVDHIKQALEIIEVDRLDHGTNITENPDLIHFLIEEDLGINVCPVAYYYTRQNMEEEAIKELYACGAKVSLHSDDPAYKGDTYINDVYCRFAQEAHWGKAELTQIAKNSFAASWIDDEEKAAYIAQIDEYVKADAVA
jgi:adenine deaminase